MQKPETPEDPEQFSRRLVTCSCVDYAITPLLARKEAAMTNCPNRDCVYLLTLLANGPAMAADISSLEFANELLYNLYLLRFSYAGLGAVSLSISFSGKLFLVEIGSRGKGDLTMRVHSVKVGNGLSMNDFIRKKCTQFFTKKLHITSFEAVYEQEKKMNSSPTDDGEDTRKGSLL
ncbi:hypothetical protein C0J52_16342 [Blattella germanica]|nr:hypothetical protein C0J52_16342 [Blattella germanica]